MEPIATRGAFLSLSGAVSRKAVRLKIAGMLIGLLLVAQASAGTPANAKGATVDSTMVWNGITRYYEVYLPPHLPSNPPMVLMLHGTSHVVPPANPSTDMWGWQSVSNKYGFILVKPASTYNSQSGQWNWDAYTMDEAFQTPPDDSGFLRNLIVTLTTRYKVNPNQIYVAGFSSGAQMAHRVGVEISDLVAAIAMGSGTIAGQESPPPVTLPGVALAPISVQEWGGTLDRTIPPCNNGITKYSGHKFHLATVDQSFNYWKQQNACTVFQNREPLCENGLPNPKSPGNDATGCASNTEVQYIWEENAGHIWTAQENAARWLFFTAHPKQPHPPKGAPSSALPSVKTADSGGANGRVGSER